MTKLPAPPASGGRYIEDPKTGKRTKVAGPKPRPKADAKSSVTPDPAPPTPHPDSKQKGAKA